MSDTPSIPASSLGSVRRPSDKPVKTYPAGRACEACQAPLSIYNPGIKCGSCVDPARSW